MVVHNRADWEAVVGLGRPVVVAALDRFDQLHRLVEVRYLEHREEVLHRNRVLVGSLE